MERYVIFREYFSRQFLYWTGADDEFSPDPREAAYFIDKDAAEYWAEQEKCKITKLREEAML